MLSPGRDYLSFIEDCRCYREIDSAPRLLSELYRRGKEKGRVYNPGHFAGCT